MKDSIKVEMWARALGMFERGVQRDEGVQQINRHVKEQERKGRM